MPVTPELPDDIDATVDSSVALALNEDIGSGDITAALIDESTQCHARVISREAAIVCGTAWFDRSFRQLDNHVVIDWLVADGDQLTEGQVLCHLTGSARAILTGERTALNFLQTLSGTATLARQYAQAVLGVEARGTGVRVLDTRKTVPGLRQAQKYAVKCGGCDNHRKGLYDGILIKENHILACGSIHKAVEKARSKQPGYAIEIEVESLAELEQALVAGADIVLLDNFSLAELHKAVSMNQGRAQLEVSGNVTLENIRAIAATGVDAISVGALTKHVRAIDFSMRFEMAK